MRCLEASELMSLRLDSALAEGEEQVLREHLAGCESCAAEWQMMQRVGTLFAQVDLMPPPPTFTQQVMGRIRRRSVWLSIMRHGLIFFLGLIILSALSLSLLVGPQSLLVAILGNTPLVNAFVGALVRLVDILGTLVRAIGLIWRAIISSPCWMVLAGYLLVAGLLALWWLRLVARPVRAVSREGSSS